MTDCIFCKIVNGDFNTEFLYEDDTTTTAYKSGFYRTTDITMDFDKGREALILKIGAAKGEFEGDRAFTERKWTVRLHTNPGWGSVTSIVVNGKVVDFDKSLEFTFDSPDCTWEETAVLPEQWGIEKFYRIRLKTTLKAGEQYIFKLIVNK